MAAVLRADFRSVIPAFVTARVVVLLGYLTIAAVGSDQPDKFDPGLIAWDGGWYRELADRGYLSLGAEGSRFFPLYPWTARTVEALSPLSTTWALVIVSNLASLVVLVLARRVALSAGSTPRQAELAVWTTALYPASFSLVWGYSESLMLVGVLGAWLAARHGRWWLAALLAAAAGLARPSGAAIAFALAVEAWPRLRRFDPRSTFAPLVAVIAAPAAGAGFVWWVGDRLNDPLAPLDTQNELRGDLVLPVVRLAQTLAEIVEDPFGDGLHAPFAFALCALAIAAFWVLPRSLAVYAAAVTAVSVGAENLNSLERYGLNAWPVILVLAHVLDRWRRLTVPALAASGLAMAAMAALAWNGNYVP